MEGFPSYATLMGLVCLLSRAGLNIQSAPGIHYRDMRLYQLTPTSNATVANTIVYLGKDICHKLNTPNMRQSFSTLDATTAV